jgi:predicted Zn-dependent protease
MRLLLIALLSGAALSSAFAQRRGDTSRRGRASATTAVRGELATVLLQSGRYDEAAREFRLLLERDPNSYDYRLGLAKALAWGEHPRAAEGELELLAAKHPGVAIIDSLLRSVRDAYDPRAAEAAGWVGNDPGYAPYRLALARALARERMSRLAIAQYDTLLSNPGRGAVPDRATLLREMADSYVGAGDRLGGAARLVAALALTPNDTALRHTVAGMLVDAHRYADALAQYDTLMAASPSSPLLLERAQVELAAGDRRRAESDLQASVSARPSSAAYLLLGDLFRERGDYRGARSMYVAASQNTPREMRLPVAEALALLDREERPSLVGPVVGDDPGWRLGEQLSADNLGVAYSALSLRRTVAIASATRMSLEAEWRQLAEHNTSRHVDLAGYGATVGGWQEVAYGPLLARLAADGGAVYHPLVGTFGQAHGALSAWLFAWQGAVESSIGPAYPSLFSVEALLPGGAAQALTERDVAFSLAGPLADADVGGRVERSFLSDGNHRTTIEATARYQLLPNVYAVYSLSRVGFARRSTLYWDPAHYTANGLGLGYDRRRARGLSFSAQLLPAYASALESSPSEAAPASNPDGVRGPLELSTAMQFGAEAELGYRAARWELASAASYGRGRAGNYERAAFSLAMRLVP